MDSDRNFQFGMQALAKGLIDPVQLAEAGRDWLMNPRYSLADILESRGWISHADRAALEETAPQGPLPIDADAPTVTFGADVGSNADGMVVAVLSDSTLSVVSGQNGSNPRNHHGWESGNFGARYQRPFFHAKGGIGQVWKVRDVHLGRDVALKELRPENEGDHRAEKRFRAEARITAKLEHPNIVPMHDLPPDTVRPYYTMRFLDGMTLKTAVHEFYRARPDGPPPSLDFRGLLERFVSVCNAIAFAHEQRIIHRDLKGQNIMLGPFGEVAVLDWGLARELDSDEDPLAQPAIGSDDSLDDESRTIEGFPIGTAQYMPPEQALGSRDTIGPRSDIFGLGAILYLILTGHAPYEGGDQKELIKKAKEHDFPAPSKLRRDVPSPLESICLKAMAMEVGNRYKTAGEVGEDVRRWLADEPTTAHPEGPMARSARWARKHQPLVAGLVALLFTGSIAFGIGEWRIGIEAEKKLAAEQRQFEARADADASLRTAVKTILDVLGIVQTDLPKVRDPGIDSVRSKIADVVAGFASALSNRHPTDLEIRIAVSGALREAAKTRALTYQFVKSEQLCIEAISTLAKARGVDEAAASLIGGKGDETLAQADRTRLLSVDQRIAKFVVGTTLDIAKARLQRGDIQGAEAAASGALGLVREWKSRAPKAHADPRRAVAHALVDHAEIALLRGDAATAIDEATLALDEFDALAAGPAAERMDAVHAAIAGIHLGRARHLAREFAQAEAAFLRAQSRLKPLHASDSSDPDVRHVEALARLFLAELKQAAGDPVAAKVILKDELMQTFDQLARDRPAILDFRVHATLAHIVRGEVRGGEISKEEFSTAIVELSTMLNEAPEAIPLRGLRARAELGLARLELAAHHTIEATTLMDQAEADFKAVLTLYPNDPDARLLNTALIDLRKKAGVTIPR